MIYPDRRDVLTWGAMLGLYSRIGDAASREPDEIPDSAHDRPRRDVQTHSTSVISKHDLSDSSALSDRSFQALLRDIQKQSELMKVHGPRLSELSILQSLGTETEVPASSFGPQHTEYSYESWSRPFAHEFEPYLDKAIGAMKELASDWFTRSLDIVSRSVYACWGGTDLTFESAGACVVSNGGVYSYVGHGSSPGMDLKIGIGYTAAFLGGEGYDYTLPIGFGSVGLGFSVNDPLPVVVFWSSAEILPSVSASYGKQQGDLKLP